jgi:lipid-binding SYLF domain-containing protein
MNLLGILSIGLATVGLLFTVSCGGNISPESHSNSALSETPNPSLGPLQRNRIIEDVGNAAAALSGALRTHDFHGQRILTDYILTNTQCVIAMRITKGAFLLGGEGGVGLMSCRLGWGWSAPSFVRAGGFDLSAAIGFQSVDMTVFITDPGTAARYKGQGNFEARPFLSAVAASADIALKQTQRYGLVTVQSDPRGLYAGVGISFTSLSHMQAARNQIVYGSLFNAGFAGEPVDANGRACSTYLIPTRRNACVEAFNVRVGGGVNHQVTADLILNTPAEHAPELTRAFNDVLRLLR